MFVSNCIIFLIFTILHPSALFTSCERLSGLYVDNGHGKTIRATNPDNSEFEKNIEQDLLNLLDLPSDRPVNLNKIVEMNKSSSQFLLNVYKSQVNENEDLRLLDSAITTDFKLNERDVKNVKDSEVVAAIASQKAPNVQQERPRRLWFDVSKIKNEVTLNNAQLRLYRKIDRKLRKRRHFRLTIYLILRSDDGRELRYVDSANITSDQEGWIVFNVTDALKFWINDPTSNRGLYMTAYENDQHELRPKQWGIVNNGLKEPDKQPFMVGYFKYFGKMQINRPKESVVRKIRQASVSPRTNFYSAGSVQYNTKVCKMQNLYVSFRDLGWHDWIIAPDGYNAHFCSGACNFPLSAHMNASNHAIVQTLVHLVSPNRVPKPCCAPTRLAPISLIYFLDEGNAVYKIYQNMVVKSCGCL